MRAAFPRRDPPPARGRPARAPRGALRGPAREGDRPRRSPRERQHRRRVADRQGARREAELPFVDRVDVDAHLDGARHAPADHLREEPPQDPRHGRGRRRACTCVVGRSVRHGRARRRARSSSGSRSRRRVAARERDRSTPSTASTSARPAAASSRATRRASTRRGRRRRHPRLRRRGADHPLGQLALPPGDEGARERHPHRAGREGGHRPLPDRRRALRRAPRAAAVHELASSAA